MDEIAEAVLIAAQREHEERKLPYIAKLLAFVAFESEIDQGMANYLVKLASTLTYRQYCLLEIANNCERYNLQPPGRLNLSQRENEIAAEDVANVVLIKAANVRDMADQIRACGIVRGDIFPDLQHLAEEFKGLP